jgi:hypothetical protein
VRQLYLKTLGQREEAAQKIRDVETNAAEARSRADEVGAGLARAWFKTEEGARFVNERSRRLIDQMEAKASLARARALVGVPVLSAAEARTQIEGAESSRCASARGGFSVPYSQSGADSCRKN